MVAINDPPLNKRIPKYNKQQKPKYKMSKSLQKKPSHSEQPWQCPSCTFKNHATITACQMCTSLKPGADEMKIERIGSRNGGFRCHACEFQLEMLVKICPNCQEVLIPESEGEEEYQSLRKEEKKDRESKLLKCPSCTKQNDPTNTTCVYCESNMQEQPIPVPIPTARRAGRKPRAPRPAKPGILTCRYCKIYVHGATLEAHQAACTHISGQVLEEKFLLVQKKSCTFCYEKFDSAEYDSHEKQCKSRKEFFSLDNPTFQRCTKLQRQTMIYMHNKSQKLHWIAQESLIRRITSLGFKASDLENLHHYIVNYAPIIIHMHVNAHMQFFVKDTHYRNQFQTKKSSGSLSSSARTNWEDRMFDRLHHNATPFERVKYGTINFTNDPKGVRACMSYGQSYFLLKPHVRNRCTVTDMDSSSPSATIATFQFCYHLLNKLPDAELRAAFQGSKAQEVASNVIGTYKEIQIHGPVEFKKDIERVYVNKSELADPTHFNMVKEFCKNNDLEYEVFQYEKVSSPSLPFGVSGIFAPAPMPMLVSSGFGFGSAFPSTSLFSAPHPTASTAHLFSGRRTVFPEPAMIPARIQKKQQELQQGIDYI